MANNYSDTSFILPLTHEQRTIINDALVAVLENEPRAIEAYRKAIAETPFERFVQCYIQHHPDRDEANLNAEDVEDVCLDELSVGACIQDDERGYWITHDEYVLVDHVCAFVQAVLFAFDSDERVIFGVASGCEKPRIGEFGGVAICVTKEGSDDYISTYDYEHINHLANQSGEKYYCVTICETFGEVECESQALLKVTKEGAGLDDSLFKLMRGWRDGSSFNEDVEGFETPYGSLVQITGHKDVTPWERETLKAYLVELSF